MITAGPGVFFDGVTSARRSVTVELTAEALRVRAADGDLLAEWPYHQLEAVPGPDHVLRLAKVANSVLARIEIRDPQLAAVIDERSLPIDRARGAGRRLRAKVIVWSVAAAASLLAVAVFAVPRIAARLTPLVPYPVERTLGRLIDTQVRASLDTRRAGAFECGDADIEKPGLASFKLLMDRIETAAALPIPLDVRVVRRPEANAITLPGGYIYVFAGLVDRARTPDELAGVIAHEVGHVANRDGTRTVIGAAGLSLLLGVLLGDFFGGGATMMAAQTVLQTSHTREVETDADRYAVGLMSGIGGDARALGRILLRVAGTTHSGPLILHDHPETEQRVAAIEAMAPPPLADVRNGGGRHRPLLEQAEWAALKDICAGS
jgi:Zn-dependent protease with chaperone function